MEELHGAVGDLLDGGAALGSGAEVKRAAEGGGVEGDAGDGGGDEIDWHNVEDGVGIAGYGAPQAARVNFEGPIHHLEAGGDAGLGVADDDAGAEDDAGQGIEARTDQGFGFGFGLLVGVAVALADGEFVFADQAGAFSGNVGGADVSETAQARRGGGKVEDAAGSFDVDAAGFFEGVIETDGGGGMNDAGGFGG